jgi:hypothetical protein
MKFYELDNELLIIADVLMAAVRLEGHGCASTLVRVASDRIAELCDKLASETEVVA